MWDRLSHFFDTTEFMPHGHCFLWYPQILWLHVVSDALIAAAYFSIPLSLIYFTRKRTDAPFPFLFYLFGAFIMLCGTTHLMEIWVIWHPDYGAEGIIKGVTAFASVSTAYFAWKIVPMALLLKSPQELETVNAQLRRAYDETERQVEERTAQLHGLSEQLKREIAEKDEINLKLKDALTAAEAASKAKTEFLANMSHEIRTPMNAVVGIANLLQNPNISAEKRKELIKTIQFSSVSLMELLNDLLDITKLESEQVELEKVPFNLAELVEEVIDIMDVRAKEKNIELIKKYDTTHHENFIGDPLRLRQVLMNLVSNAIKFTEKGTVTLRVEACKLRDDGLTDVCIDVIDTGIGIPLEKQQTIFSKFSQADTSITRKFGGTGLGLSICKTLIELMGGKISLVSSVGLGSKFFFNVPLSPIDTVNSRSGRNPKFEVDVETTQSSYYRPLILLAEDYKANVLVATSTIENCGYRWELAENGVEAIEKFKKQKYDLVLMDIQMPELDGINAALAIRAYEAKHNVQRTPILCVTAFSGAKERDKCLESGMDDYLTKPFNPEDLKEKMRALLMKDRN
ncbi:MAG: ATP-binding protein [Pseudomonadota bacterium]|nr:ATP-binding protein [Pseudomonadota bacterium]